MRGRVTYAPYAGTVAARILVVLERLGEATTDEIASALNASNKSIQWSIRPAMSRGAVVKVVRVRDDKRVFVYTLHKPQHVVSERDWAPPRRAIVSASLAKCPVDRPQGWASPIGIDPNATE